MLALGHVVCGLQPKTEPAALIVHRPTTDPLVAARNMQAFWALADADDPAASAWLARPKSAGSQMSKGRPQDLMLFATNASDLQNRSAVTTPPPAKRKGRSTGLGRAVVSLLGDTVGPGVLDHGAFFASLLSFLIFLTFVSLGRRSLSNPSFRARSNVWSCMVVACLSGGGSKRRLAPPPPPEPEPLEVLSFWKNAMRLMGCAFGVFVTHLTWGFLQERIMTQPYPAAPYYFTSSNFLVLSNRFAAVLVSAAVRILHRPKTQRFLPPYKYSFCAYANVVSSMCQYEMLKYVSFPAQVLSKSCKMLPVMVMSFFVSGKRHGYFDWLVALMVVVGASAFQLGAPIVTQSTVHDGQLTGLLLIGGYIASDAFAAAWQSQLFKQSGIDIATMMLMCNIFSCIFTFAGFVVTLEFIDVWRFVQANPHALADIAVISVASAFGQTFILLTIKYYGAAVFAAIATVRQLVSILVSIGLFGHVISQMQIVAIAIVFVALAAQCFYRWRISRRAARAAAEADSRQGLPMPKPPSMPELHQTMP